jgi:hypothetical protein
MRALDAREGFSIRPRPARLPHGPIVRHVRADHLAISAARPRA